MVAKGDVNVRVSLLSDACKVEEMHGLCEHGPESMMLLQMVASNLCFDWTVQDLKHTVEDLGGQEQVWTTIVTSQAQNL